MSPPKIDLRSDTLSPSTPEMFAALARASIDMASRGEDPTVRRLEEVGADLLGTEACAFVPNVTSANLLALLAQAPRGTAVLMDRMAHVNQVEWYGITALGGMVPWLLDAARGRLDPDAVEAAFLDRNGGRNPRIGAVVLENTHNFAGGVAFPAAETAALAAIAHRHGAAVHLDGARLLNAAVALGVPAGTLTAGMDTVALSLTKGLSAPFGALLGGRRAAIDAAREIALHVGFGRFHRAGHFAAAGLVALATMPARLSEDHRRALRLADGLAGLPGLEIDLATVQTNILSLRLREVPGSGEAAPDAWAAAERLAERGVGLLPLSGGRLRAVTHRGISDADVADAIEVMADVLPEIVAKQRTTGP